VAKEPKWRNEIAHADTLLRPFSRQFPAVPVPGYVQRWIVTTAVHRRKRVDPARFAARLLTEACISYFRLHAPPIPFDLTKGFPVDPHSDEAATLDWLKRISEGDEADPARDLILEPCLFNGVYAWFFYVTDVPKFKQWAAEQWTGNRRKLIDRAGWPVIRLQKGDWPIDPRLLPGSPVASPELREEGETND
jgi:hypothetical protein